MNAEDRDVVDVSKVHKVRIKFNGDYLTGFYLVIDARTKIEKEENKKNKKLDGSVITFFQGHLMRPDNALWLTSELAKKSKSGIVVVPVCISANFYWEILGISFVELFRGNGGKSFDAGAGIAQGWFGDTLRSGGSCIGGNFHLFKPLRSYQDIQDVSIQANDLNFPVSNLKNIVVLLAKDDFIFSPKAAANINNYENPSKERVEKFWEKFYPTAKANGTNFHLKVMPGNHLSPSVYYKKWTDEALKVTKQMR